jgi:hypothetical protein
MILVLQLFTKQKIRLQFQRHRMYQLERQRRMQLEWKQFKKNRKWQFGWYQLGRNRKQKMY